MINVSEKKLEKIRINILRSIYSIFPKIVPFIR